jgi:hypothetical protein
LDNFHKESKQVHLVTILYKILKANANITMSQINILFTLNVLRAILIKALNVALVEQHTTNEREKWTPALNFLSLL